MKTKRVGDHALLVLVDDAWSAVATRRLILDLATGSTSANLAVPVDVVPAARTVLVNGLPDARAVEAWRSRLDEERPPVSVETLATAGRSVTIDVTYDGADLAVVGEAWGCSPEAVVQRHRATRFRVAFCGFAPGFAYCVATPPLPEVSRRSEPRERVPAGSVALAGEYCGIYPAAMPGGWQLIGTTTARLFDPERADPALLTPGDGVRFRVAT